MSYNSGMDDKDKRPRSFLSILFWGPRRDLLSYVELGLWVLIGLVALAMWLLK